MKPELKRQVFTTSRELEYFSESELVIQTGCPREKWWPGAIVKELVDNSLDACEQAGITASITVCDAPGVLTVSDNGPGLPADVVERNVVFYVEDIVPDPSKFATDPNVTTLAPPKNFFRNNIIGDIQAVNGQRVMGTYIGTGPAGVVVRVAPTPGQSIADTVRNGAAVYCFEILKSDGTPIGTIMATGLTGGASPPGSPSNVTGNNFAVTGGTGAFLGARGQAGTVDNPPGVVPLRGASITEDPANRRLNGGGSQQWVFHLIPMESPEIVMSSGGPAISHSSDFSLVTASKPAAAGETLSLFAKGLGPVNPRVDPGAPFPSSPLATVNSPVEVTVNGKAAEVLSAVGYPGAVDGYQVNFRVPPDTAKGPASIQVSAAWISGTPVSIPVQ